MRRLKTNVHGLAASAGERVYEPKRSPAHAAKRPPSDNFFVQMSKSMLTR